MNLTRKLILLGLLSISIFPSMSFAGGHQSGGGGDVLEIQFDDIRDDLLSWVTRGGALAFHLPESMYQEYVKLMIAELQPHSVTVGFTPKKVIVDGIEKTCKGFYRDDTQGETKVRFPSDQQDHFEQNLLNSNDLPHISCNIRRFTHTGTSERYALVHHEYLGLTGFERNQAGSSSYDYSKMITDNLAVQSILRLRVKDIDRETQGVDLNDCSLKAINRAISGFTQYGPLKLTWVKHLPAYFEQLALPASQDVNQVKLYFAGFMNINQDVMLPVEVSVTENFKYLLGHSLNPNRGSVECVLHALKIKRADFDRSELLKVLPRAQGK